MSVLEILQSGDAAAAAQALVARRFPHPQEDPVVVDAVTGFAALRKRMRAADEWITWLKDARSGLEQLARSTPPSALLQPGWLEEANSVGVEAAVFAERLIALHLSFAEMVPTESTGGRPRRMVGNFAYTLNFLWARAGRARLTPSVLALVALAADRQVDGALWEETMRNVGRKTKRTQPWADILRSVRAVDANAWCIETFTVRMMGLQ